MNTKTILILAAICGVFLAGCKAPTKTAAEKLEAVQSAKDKVGQVEEAKTELGRGAVYATGKALELAGTNSPPVEVAKQMNDRAALALGNPSPAAGLEWLAIVNGLLQTNAAERARFVAMLELKDRELGATQGKLVEAEAKLAKAEKSRDASLLDFAEDADAFRKWRRRILVVVGVLAIGAAMPIIAGALSVIPGFGVIAGPAASIVGGLARMTFKALPLAAEKAGVVSSSYRDGLTQMVRAVRAYQDEAGPGFAPLGAKLDRALDDETRPITRQIRQTAPPL